jgi:hypothetical protein
MNSSDLFDLPMFVKDDNESDFSNDSLPDFSHCPDYDKAGDQLLDSLGFYLEGIFQVTSSSRPFHQTNLKVRKHSVKISLILPRKLAK